MRFLARGVLAALVLCLAAEVSSPAFVEAQTKQHRLPAPTYYLAIHAQRSEPDTIHFRGASNLPPGSNVAIQVADFDHDGWKDYSERLCVGIDEQGFFEGDIPPKKDMKFRSNLILRADFETQLCEQPSKTLEILGKHGGQLANLGDSKVPYTEFSGHSRNPQLFQVSGWNYGLEAIDRVVTGETWPTQ